MSRVSRVFFGVLFSAFAFAYRRPPGRRDKAQEDLDQLTQSIVLDERM
jgi:hypothetical protein